MGYEADGCELTWIDGQLAPTEADGTPEEFEIRLEYVALRLYGGMSTAPMDRLAHGHAVLGMFQRPGEGMVITAGCTDWARGLDPIPDRDIKTITRNILDRFGA